MLEKKRWLIIAIKYRSSATALFESFAQKPVKSPSEGHRRLENNPRYFVQILHVNIDDVWDAI